MILVLQIHRYQNRARPQPLRNCNPGLATDFDGRFDRLAFSFFLLRNTTLARRTMVTLVNFAPFELSAIANALFSVLIFQVTLAMLLMGSI